MAAFFTEKKTINGAGRKSMIKIQYEEDKNRAAAYDGETEIGESAYSPSEDMWIIDHTLVDATYGGKGIAGKLVAKLVEKAREKDVKILPRCTFAKREFEKNAAYRDILKKQ